MFQCEDFRSTCQEYVSATGVKDGVLIELCKEAESCACDSTDHDVKIVNLEIDIEFYFGKYTMKSNYTVGLYDECK